MAGQYREGQRLQGSDGNIYVVQNGVPVLEGSASAPVGPADPARVLDADYKRAQIAKAQREAAQSAATAPYDAQKAAAEARKEAALATKAEREAAAGGNDPRQAEQQKTMALDEVLGSIARARGQIGTLSTGFPGQVLGKIGGTNARDLSGTLNTIGSRITMDTLAQLKSQSSTGASGFGALSEREGALLRDAVASLDQAQSQDQLLQNLANVELHYRRVNALMKGENPDDPKVAQKYGIAALPGGAVGGGGRGAGGPPAPLDGPLAPSDGTRTAIDPSLRGVNAEVARRIRARQSPEQIRAYLDKVQPGLGAKAQNIEQWVNFSRQHPDQPIPVQLDRVQVPLGTGAAMLNKAAQSPAGAYFANAADALTLGNLDSATSNPELSRAALGGMQQMNPNASLLGTVTGGALAAGGIEAGLARAGVPVAAAAGQGYRGLGGATFAPRAMAADLLFGTGYGAGANDDNRLGGAVSGGLSAVGGGIFGRGAARVAGGAATGVKDAGKLYLNEARIPMTIGQMAGGRLKGLEDRLAGFPIVGDAINARRREGIREFNRAAFDEALAPIAQGTAGNIGENGIQTAQDAVSGAYDQALGGVRLHINDPQFMSDISGAVRKGASLPNLGPQFRAMMDSRLVNMIEPNGTIPGNRFQDIIQGLRKARTSPSIRNDVLGDEFGNATRDVEAAMMGLADRQAPGVTQDLAKANTAYGNLSVLEDAVLRAQNAGGTFSPAQLGMSARSNAARFGGKKGSAAGKRPFFDLQRAGQDTLPSQVPDSGTAGRMVIPLALGAAAGGGNYAASEDAGGSLGTGLAAAALAASPYSPLARYLAQKAAFAPRPKGVVKAGNLILDRSYIGGLLGAPLAVDAWSTP